MVATLPGLPACGPGGSAPILDPLSDGTAYVGSEYRLELRASDQDADELHFQFGNNDLMDIADRAEIRNYGSGTAVFKWTPIAADVGVHPFDFIVSDGTGNQDTETIEIEVKSGVGENTAPIFRQPLGTGTTLDLALMPCLDLDIVVEDSDTPQIEITQEEPSIEGASLDQSGGFTGTWHWCPSPEQIDAQDRYALTLGANDGDNPMTIKNFLVVLRKVPRPGCEGDPPVIAHTPTDESTVVGLTVSADISDTEGLKGDPLFYYSLVPMSDPPDVSQMTQLTMINIDGATWAADVPNPVASMPAGSTADLYYVIVAQDDDDPMGDCDHLTQAPMTGTYHMTVTNPGGSGGLGLCEECTADVQCGGDADNCVRMGSAGLYYCFTACDDTPGSCPTDYYCSITSFMSIDGAMARQCIPNDYSCVDTPPPSCTDDSYEENDSRLAAAALSPGTYPLTSCPDGTSQDQDWFELTIGSDSQVTLSIDGSHPPDLDLSLTDSTGAVLVTSTGLTSVETVSRCLTPGTYYARVYSVLSPAETAYTFTYTATAMSCGAAMCADDAEEPDDDYSSSRRVDYDVPYSSSGNQICDSDDDWYRVYLFSGETVHATLAFTQTTSDQDLDLHLYKGTMDLTPCTEAAPSACDPLYGQGYDSNEDMHYTVDESRYYYVVVHGWDHSENSYDICIALNDVDCVPL